MPQGYHDLGMDLVWWIFGIALVVGLVAAGWPVCRGRDHRSVATGIAAAAAADYSRSQT
jgi:hypothetical protein